MYHQMPPQMAHLRWRITTQVAFEWLFSAVSVCLRRCIIINHTDCIRVTYLLCVFSNVPWNGLHRRTPTAFAFVWFFFIVCFKCLITVRRFLPSRTVAGPKLTGQSMWWNNTMSFSTWWWWRRKSGGYTFRWRIYLEYHHQIPRSYSFRSSSASTLPSQWNSQTANFIIHNIMMMMTIRRIHLQVNPP